MMVDVFMKDGRTTFRFTNRGRAIAAMKRQPLKLDEEGSLGAWVRWQVESEWAPCRVVLISPGSISMVVEVPPEQRDAFLEPPEPVTDSSP